MALRFAEDLFILSDLYRLNASLGLSLGYFHTSTDWFLMKTIPVKIL